ncbi:MAG TPA: pectinesterase family protein [Pseudonocardiaceae bacterium]|nr:pectinesterase family protein [Pseudonocardiaceae bacterium]
MIVTAGGAVAFGRTVAVAGPLGAVASPLGTVASPLGAPVRLESNGGCVDGPLRLDFASTPQLGSSGTIDIHRADGTVVDNIDLADPASARENVGDAVSDTDVPHLFSYYPVIVSGNVASVHPHRQLDYGRSYYLTVSAGVFAGQPAITDPWTLRLRTRSRTPRVGADRLTVATDGSGDFCSVQGAIDYVPEGNQRPVTIDVRPGVYTEIDYVRADRAHITVRGDDRDTTIIQYANNDKLNGDEALDNTQPANICPLRQLPVPDLTNCWRALFGVDAPDFTLENITLRNTTPFGGSQAEAFRGNNQHITLDRVTLDSFQDTLRLQGTGFVTNSYIKGDVDFVWGTGSVFVQHSELKAMHAGYYTQIRNDADHHGDVFVDDRISADSGVAAGSVYLGRIQLSRFPASQADYIDDAMGPQIAPAGWLLMTGYGDCSQAQSLRWGEYQSTDLAGNPLDTGQRLACSSQLSAAQAGQLSDPGVVLSGWVPATVNVDSVGAQRFSVNWSAPVGHSAGDRVVLERMVGAVGAPVAMARVDSAATTGSLVLESPKTRAGGLYRVVYLPAGSVMAAATSEVVSVG